MLTNSGQAQRQSDTRKRLADYYGVNLDSGTGMLMRGNATDEQYETALAQYRNLLVRDTVAQEQREADAKFNSMQEYYLKLLEDEKSALAQQKTDARRETSVMTDRLSRYLPYLRRANGTEGSGVSDSTDIAMYNSLLRQNSAAEDAYRQALLEANKNYAQTQLSLDREKQAADLDRYNRLANADVQADSDTQSVFRRYREQAQQQSAEYYTSVTASIENKLQSLIEANGRLTSEGYGELKRYAEQFRNGLEQNERKQLDLLLTDYGEQVQNEETGTAEAGVTGPYKAKNGYNFEITVDGTEYRVQVAGTTTDADVLAAARKVGVDKPFLYNGVVYVMSGGNKRVARGTVMRVEGRATNDTDYRSLRARLSGT